MKRTVAILGLGMILSTGSFAAKYGTAGCGLGSIIFGAKPGMIQIVAATFNGTGGNQSFAITSGTSNCVGEGDGRTAELFIIGNRDALEKDISRGNGEALANLAEIMGCSSHQELGSKLQSNYSNIFSSQSVGSEEVSNSILNAVKSDDSLSSDCGNV